MTLARLGFSLSVSRLISVLGLRLKAQFPKPGVRGSSPLRDAKKLVDFAGSYLIGIFGLLPISAFGKHMGSRMASPRLIAWIDAFNDQLSR
jgi:hypothetical protein